MNIVLVLHQWMSTRHTVERHIFFVRNQNRTRQRSKNVNVAVNSWVCIIHQASFSIVMCSRVSKLTCTGYVYIKELTVFAGFSIFIKFFFHKTSYGPRLASVVVHKPACASKPNGILCHIHGVPHPATSHDYATSIHLRVFNSVHTTKNMIFPVFH